MQRGYPRFVYSHVKSGKDTGHYVVHLLFPRFICKAITPEEYEASALDVVVSTPIPNRILLQLSSFEEGRSHYKELEAMKAMAKWLTSKVKAGDIIL